MENTSEEGLLKCLEKIDRNDLLFFFGALDRMLTALKLHQDDDRVVFSVRDEKRLVLIIGQRYTFDVRQTPTLKKYGFISREPRVPERDLELHAFDAKPKSYYNRTDDPALINRSFEEIIEACQVELNRTGKSGFRRNNNASFEKMAFDPTFREEMLEKIFDSIKAPGKKIMPTNNRTLNTILFGPPGTGKTYLAKEIAVEWIDGTLPDNAADQREAINQRYAELLERKQIQFVTFHQSMSYEDFVEGIKPELANDEEDSVKYKIEDGIFKRMCVLAAYEYLKLQRPDLAATAPIIQEEKPIDYEDKRKAFERIDWSQIDTDQEVPRYLLIIDEINRGNIAAILGELITLLEDDKRGGKEESLEVILPYSKSPFSVPPNLYIIGTMNTADRSVEALDTALRRRFSFREIAPDPSLLKIINRVDLPNLLTTINRRIKKLLDKDHMIGHAYFMGLSKATDPVGALKSIFHNKILPLLQEYFYGNFGKIQLVLGKDFVEKEEDETFGFADADLEISDYSQREVFTIRNVMEMADEEFIAAVNRIYTRGNGG